MKHSKELYMRLGLGILAILMLWSCANVGNPSGGARDEDPPILVRADPPNGSVNVSKTQMTLTFNEIVNVKDAFSKIVMSPSGKPPKVTSLGRRVTIKFDSLIPNTTYTLDFADAIEDNNEGNKLRNFAYTFSTGPVLDTLRIAGRVIGSRDLEPRPGMLVGVHQNISDTAFQRIPLLRVAKADDQGRFVIRGLAPGNYRVFALDDRDADFKYSSDEEEIAFYDFEVTPSATRLETTDTLYNSYTGTIDTVTTRMRTRYLPDDILLRSFVFDRRAQYLKSYERTDSNRLLIKLGAPEKRLPDIRLLGDSTRIPAIMESRAECDSITIWLPPSLASTDTINLTVGYTRYERDKEPKQILDTLMFAKKIQPAPKKKKKKEEPTHADTVAMSTFTFNLSVQSGQEVWKPLMIESPAPLAELDTAAIRLMIQSDTVWRKAPGKLSITTPDTLAPRSMSLDYPWDYGTKYKLEIDSLAAVDVYGRGSLPVNQEFSTKTAGDYCSLSLNISGLPQDIPAFVELLDGSDKVVRTAVVENNNAYFPFLAPARYYVRLIEDYNGNGLYDTGDYEKRRQPDLAYYYPKAINIKKNWDKEENWDLFSTPVDKMKPEAVLKNKPKNDKRNRKKQESTDQMEDEDEPFDPTANPFEERSPKRGRTGNSFR